MFQQSTDAISQNETQACVWLVASAWEHLYANLTNVYVEAWWIVVEDMVYPAKKQKGHSQDINKLMTCLKELWAQLKCLLSWNPQACAGVMEKDQMALHSFHGKKANALCGTTPVVIPWLHQMFH